MYRVRLNVPVDICTTAGTRTQALLSKVVKLPEPPRTDLIYRDRDLGRLTKQGTPAELLIGDYLYDLDEGVYLANCQRVVINRLAHSELQDDISWVTHFESESNNGSSKSNLVMLG